MGFKAFRTNAFEHTHENRIFNQMCRQLEDYCEKNSQDVLFFGNCLVNGVELDALLVRSHAITVIDFKDYGGDITFSENGLWTADGVEVRGGGFTNPFRQIRHNRYKVMEKFNSIIIRDKQEFGHVSGCCIFHQPITFDESQLPQNISRWFFVTDFSSALTTLFEIVSNKINLLGSDFEEIIKSMDVPPYFEYQKHSIEVNTTSNASNIQTEITCSEDSSYQNELGVYEQSLTPDQRDIWNELKTWLSTKCRDSAKIFVLDGPEHSGKKYLSNMAITQALSQGFEVVVLSPNKNKSILFDHQSENLSIYQWLYSGSTELKEHVFVHNTENKLYPNPEKTLIVVHHAHLLHNDHYESGNVKFGSGFLVNDFFDALSGKCSNSKSNDTVEMEFNCLPKILFVGDTNELMSPTSFMTCQPQEQLELQSIKKRLSDIFCNAVDNSIDEKLKALANLSSQIQSERFYELPELSNDDDSFHCIDPKAKGDEIFNQLIDDHAGAVYLCGQRKQAKLVNDWIRKKRFKPCGLLNVGDRVILTSETYPIPDSDDSLLGNKSLMPGVYSVVEEYKAVTPISMTLKGRKQPTTVSLGIVGLRTAFKTVQVYMLPKFLESEDEITIDEEIALLAEARRRIVNDLNSTDNESENKQRVAERLKSDPLRTAARLRYAYAQTVHTAQRREKYSLAIINARESHNSDSKYGTKGYFTWLYSAMTCSRRNWFIEFPSLTPLTGVTVKHDQCVFDPNFHKQFWYDSSLSKFVNDYSLAESFWGENDSLKAIYVTLARICEKNAWEITSVRHTQYVEHYSIYDGGTNAVSIRLNYDKSFQIKSLNGSGNCIQELRQKLSENRPNVSVDDLKKSGCENLINFFEEKGWDLSIESEQTYQLMVIIQNVEGLLLLRVSFNRNGQISVISVQKASSKTVLTDFLKMFNT